MKPITGLIFARANAGITSPAAPRITSASLKPLLSNPSAMSALSHAGERLSADD